MKKKDKIEARKALFTEKIYVKKGLLVGEIDIFFDFFMFCVVKKLKKYNPNLLLTPGP